MIVSPNPSNSEIEPVAFYILVNGGDLNTKHHSFIVDGLVFIQQVFHWFVNGIWCSTFNNMANPDGGFFNLFPWKCLIGSFPDSFNERRVRDGHFIILAEYGHHAIIFQVLHGGFSSVCLDER